MKKTLQSNALRTQLSESALFGQRIETLTGEEEEIPPNLHTSQPVQQETEEERTAANMVPVGSIGFTAADLTYWAQTLANTETQATLIRLTNAEHYAIEDAIRDLKRNHNVKTSLNELARLGMLVVLHDLKENNQEALIQRMKKAK